MTRHVVWFSCGATSAVTAKLVLFEQGHADTVIAYTDPGSEDDDNARFLRDCEAWFEHPILMLRSAKYRDTWQVWEERRWLNGPGGALCTVELKKKLRMAFERPDDIQYFGYDAGEPERAARFRENNPEVDLRTPLIDRGLTKADCLALIERAGLELPLAYRLGFDHANCKICVKGGMGYMNKVRTVYPVEFKRMAELERTIGASCIRETVPTGTTHELVDDHGETMTVANTKSVSVFLDELDPERGDYQTEPKIECSLLCAIVESDLA